MASEMTYWVAKK